MELRHLRYFKAIADCGSLTAAAKRLHVSQSSISEQIFDLESEIGATLLDRSGRKAGLTAEGRVFLAEVKAERGAALRKASAGRLEEVAEPSRIAQAQRPGESW
jgi:molybdate transport repressor ModE-like protein